MLGKEAASGDVTNLHGLKELKRIKKQFAEHSVRVAIGSNCCVVLSGTGFDEEAALLGAGREFALMKTASGKVRVN